MKRLLVLAALLLLSSAFVFSIDYGVLFDQDVEVQNKLVTYTPSLNPWFSWDTGKGLSMYFSFLLSLRYNKSFDDISENDGLRDPKLLFEFSRFSLTYRSGQRWSVEGGRVPYTDALGVTALGLFDGARYEMALPFGSLGAGLYYTGLQFKETAKIVMTESDRYGYTKPVESAGDYFASKRLFIEGRLDVPVLEYHSFAVETLFQFDCNGEDDALHSQYAEASFDFSLSSKAGLTTGAVLETMESGGTFGFGFGALAVLRINMSGALNSGLKLTAKFSSGDWKDALPAFTPISSLTQGEIFPGTFSGLFLFKASYDVRILPSLYAQSSLAYFMRTYSEPGSDGNLYGGEIWASFAWQPFDDLRASLGGGVFIPQLGNAYPSGTDPMWKISVGISLSF